MNTGKTLFAQLMDFLPWSTFDRIVARYHGNRAVRTFPCAAQYQVMAFAQITYRESLRDQALAKLGVDPPIAGFVSVGQRGTANRPSQTHMIELGRLR